MNFTVTWTPNAEQKLAALWLAAADQNAITAAAARIDILLSRAPQTRGAPVFDTVRSLVVSPLGVDFEVVDDDRIVFVLDVWDSQQPTP